jgi:hypothetical protein
MQNLQTLGGSAAFLICIFTIIDNQPIFIVLFFVYFFSKPFSGQDTLPTGDWRLMPYASCLTLFI